MMQAAMHLVRADIAALVDKRVEQQIREMGAPNPAAMAREGGALSSPPPPVAYYASLRSRVPQAPPIELYETWCRNKAAITIQKHHRSATKTLAGHVRRALIGLPEERKMLAMSVNSTIDSIASLIQKELGTNVWARAIHNAPADWEEGEMVSAMRDVVQRPTHSAFLWLLARPTRYERALLHLSDGVSKTHESRREVLAACKIQKCFRGRSKRLAVMLRFSLEGIPSDVAAMAAGQGLDAMAALICDRLGKNVWARAVHNAPDDWEEDQMVFAIREVLCQPKTSSYVWLLAKPTKHERMLMTAFSVNAKAFNATL